ncbi:hypothetical protein NDU88_005496 [Pleurodeles waltl]|uniref:Uncharacterized protein n=1 Tax=Pleurodeles waltl TaxID=8319 RepID=A0AAV7PJ12_PLEWA|nr:hypothetical protein NDU88_005496 [Pleurodeles waltl]
MWCNRNQVLKIKAEVVLGQEHNMTARVVLLEREMCGVLPHPRAGGLHGDGEFEYLARSPWRSVRHGREKDGWKVDGEKDG